MDRKEYSKGVETALKSERVAYTPDQLKRGIERLYRHISLMYGPADCWQHCFDEKEFDTYFVKELLSEEAGKADSKTTFNRKRAGLGRKS